MKKIIIFIVCSLVISVAGSCNTQNFRPSGAWKRNIAEQDLGVTGTEYLYFTCDSSFMVTTEMDMAYSDTLFDCKLRFHTRVEGYWHVYGDDLLLYYEPNSYRFDTISGNVKISATDKKLTDSLSSAMLTDLSKGLADYYYTIYEEHAFPDGLQLKSPAISGEIFGAFLCDTIVVRWHRL